MKNYNRNVLLQGFVLIEQFDENNNRIEDKKLSLSLFPDAIDDALDRFDNKDDVLNQMVDNVSDIAEDCVTSYSVDEDSLKF